MDNLPFRPTQISNFKEKDDIVGIISNEHLQGLLDKIEASLHFPIAVVEFPEKKDTELIWTESKFISNDSRAFCSMYRDLNDNFACKIVEESNANLFLNLKYDDQLNSFDKNVKSNESQKKLIKDKGFSFNFDIHDIQKRLFLEVDCPISGYRAIGIPIFYNKKSAGVLFVW